MLDSTSRNVEHRCFHGHMWKAFATINGTGIVAYGNVLDAVCPYCRNQSTSTQYAQVGAIAIQRLTDSSVIPSVYHQCANPKCRTALYTPMEPAANITLTALDKLTGISYWRIQVPFPLYCTACAASRVLVR